MNVLPCEFTADADAVQPSRRGGRQLLGQRGPCLTSKGAVGKCTTFKECYPFFKIPNLSALDGWVLGIYDTCSYTQPDGRLTFGICCADPPTLPTPGSDPGGPIVEAPDDQYVCFWNRLFSLFDNVATHYSI